MKILITGICGFAGSTIALEMLKRGYDVSGIDNLIRPGSEKNRQLLRTKGVTVLHGDIRCASDLETIGAVDWVLDAAANPSVLGGMDGRSSSRQLVEHNLSGTINLLEFCKKHGSGFVLLSTSRVYSIAPLARLGMKVINNAFQPDETQDLPTGITPAGVTEIFSTAPPVSLYGSTKLASEILALEYGASFEFPVWINRCGVLAGAGQFGRADQGIFSFWLHAWHAGRPLKYTGFGGKGHQVRDCLHPRDLLPVLERQFAEPLRTEKPRVANFSGGSGQCISLANLSAWCELKFGSRTVSSDMQERTFDIPWMVLDSTLAKQTWNWTVSTSLETILEEISDHVLANPDWLDSTT